MRQPSHGAHRDPGDPPRPGLGVAGCGGSATQVGILDPDRGGILSAPLAAALARHRSQAPFSRWAWATRPAPHDIHFQGDLPHGRREWRYRHRPGMLRVGAPAACR